MISIRLFTGLSLPPDITAKLNTLLGQLHPLARIGWCHPANLHVTTKFIGDWPFSRTPELSRLLFSLPREGAIPVKLTGLEFFPHAMVVRIADSAPLQSLASHTDSALAALGIRPETRGYRPHITIARIPGPAPLDALRNKVATMATECFGAFVASEFHLYQSHMSVYRELATIPLT